MRCVFFCSPVVLAGRNLTKKVRLLWRPLCDGAIGVVAVDPGWYQARDATLGETRTNPCCRPGKELLRGLRRTTCNLADLLEGQSIEGAHRPPRSRSARPVHWHGPGLPNILADRPGGGAAATDGRQCKEVVRRSLGRSRLSQQSATIRALRRQSVSGKTHQSVFPKVADLRQAGPSGAIIESHKGACCAQG